MMGYGDGFGFGMGGWLWMLGGVLLLVGVVVLIVWLIGRAGQTSHAAGTPGTRPANEDAAEILRLRFARGEITADEYAAARRTLEDGR